MTGRTLPVYQRVYIGGYDMSGYANDTGEQGITYPETPLPAFSDAVLGYGIGKPSVTFGPLNACFDNTATSGFHVVENAAQGTVQNVMDVYGMRAAPAVGDVAFCAPLVQTSYKAVGAMSTVTFGGLDVVTNMLYDEFWGNLLHVYGTENAANSSNTPNVDGGGETLKGGWLMYHIYSITGSGTITISIDDSANGTAWLALSGATSGAIATASAPISGIVQLGVGATVRQYLRWQMAKGGSAASCYFTLAFMRGR